MTTISQHVKIDNDQSRQTADKRAKYHKKSDKAEEESTPVSNI